MAKRFIDTNMFNDEWICELPKDAKLFFIYFITTCDHAGVLRLNKKLCEFQTGLKSIDTLIEQLGNSLVTLNKESNIFWLPKFIKFQYPNFPQSQVKQQESAIKILESFKIDIANFNSYLTLNKDLTKSYVSDNVNVGVINNKGKKVFFKDCEIFSKPKFQETFKDWSLEKCKYYFESVLTWSNEGNKKIDWVATVRTWANRDEKEGKIKFEAPKKQTEAPDYESFRNG